MMVDFFDSRSIYWVKQDLFRDYHMLARIKFELQNPDRYDSFHESFIVDATIENNRLYRNAHMGFEGSINNDLYPFVLLTDGKIDMERLIRA